MLKNAKQLKSKSLNNDQKFIFKSHNDHHGK